MKHLLVLLLACSLAFGKRAQLICPLHTIQARHQASELSMSRLKASTAPRIRGAVLNVGTTKEWKVLNNVFSQGLQTKRFLLRQKLQSNTPAGLVDVNIWVGEQEYQEQSPNNLNSQSSVSGAQIQANRDTVLNEVVTVLSNVILPATVATFGALNPVNNSPSEGLNIMIYDIQDNFGSGNGSYVGGYFDPQDKFGGTSGGTTNDNASNMLHMDIHPMNPGGRPSNFGITKKDFYHVLTHELQHILHAQSDNEETIWVNEGFSQYAIWRVLHQARFPLDNSLILDSPRDEPSQVPFWLQSPNSSLLMTTDEPGLADTSGPRSDSAELRGLGYLFFNYLWQRMGGDIDGGKAQADAAIKQMIASTARGRASLEAGLAGSGLDFNQVFRDFAVALIADQDLSTNPRYRLDSFTAHGSTRLSVSPFPLGDSVSIELKPWQFKFFQISPDTPLTLLSTNGGAYQGALVSNGEVLVSGHSPEQNYPAQSNGGILVLANASPNTMAVSNGPVSLSAEGGDGGGGCFLATAAFGSYVHPAVTQLRGFRDQVLLTNALGRKLIALYYHYSPALARTVSQSKGLRQTLRLLLWPVTLLVANLPLMGLLLLMLLLVVFGSRRKVF